MLMKHAFFFFIFCKRLAIICHLTLFLIHYTAQKMKFTVKDFFGLGCIY